MTMEGASSDARCSGGGNLASVTGPGGGSEAAVVEADSLQAAASSPGNNSSPTAAEQMQNDDMDADDEDDEDDPLSITDSSNNSLNRAPTSREMRNRAEKQRRDKLNTYIQELSQINPLISSSERKMDKTSVLRLSAALMRLKKCREALEESMECEMAAEAQPAVNSFDNNNSICKSDAVNNKSSAATLPSSSSSVKSFRSKQSFSPWLPFPESLTEHMLEDMNSFLLILAGNGKIIYVSTSVVKLLGHTQSELMGQSLYNFTCKTDHEFLRSGLQIDPDGDPGPNINARCQRKNFFIKLCQKSTGRSDSAQFEVFQIIGSLKVLGGNNNATNAAEAHSTQICRKSTGRIRESGSSHQGQNQNQPDVVLMAIAKMANLRTSNLVCMDSNKEEYFTRHNLDGDIMFCDQRVSITCGYMVDELCGSSAFRYVHVKDLNWLLVSLRQMFTKNGFGYSTYRLLSKTGDFVYMRSHGTLEFDKETSKVISFVCVNTLLSEEDGKKGVEEMKKRFNANTKNSQANIIIKNEELGEDIDMMKDPFQMTQMIKKLLRTYNVPQTPVNEEVPESEYRKCFVASKSLPPPTASMKIMQRRSSTASGTPMHNQVSPTSPGPSKNCATRRPSKFEQDLHPLPSESHQLDTRFQTGKGTCVGRPRSQRQRAASQDPPVKQSRRGRPRGSGIGTKRKAVKCEADTPTAKRSLHSTISFTCEDQSFKVLHASVVDEPLSMGLWDDSGNSIMEGMSSLCDDSQGLAMFDDFHLQLSPSQHSLQVQTVAKTTMSESNEDTASVCGAIHELTSSIDRQPDIGI
ncbi:circadian locomoter output cycles protein kaput-like isoform X2 [Cloeon dipterum]|uniref:circadian locomoter output cycles protein kaput-like isoform X2 n=1 Tax=Cloeon dipterum TaxID=197152 RepID=UPI0032200ACA